ncbi:hypothetical protein Taro_016332 [Colocasia esculenta]|uniref:Uncharacterized protein n=1 Tax=Colocasia esculenta TaxID=4460 RepID=A0A843UN84_COLES|nr:hypothetical protein [Colocasia esculenta]
MGLQPCGLQAVIMADRRDWGGGGDDSEESTQWMIERIWESLTDIRMRMDHCFSFHVERKLDLSSVALVM